MYKAGIGLRVTGLLLLLVLGFSTHAGTSSFFSGAYFSPRISSNSDLIRHLVRPAMACVDCPPLRGNELTDVVGTLLKQNSALVRTAGLRFPTSEEPLPNSDAISVFLPNAYHQTWRVKRAADRADYTYVEIYLAAVLDLLSDRASKFERVGRYESVFTQVSSELRRFRSAGPEPTQRELRAWYSETLASVIRALASKSAERLNWEKGRKPKLIQLEPMVFTPKVKQEFESLGRQALGSQAGDPASKQRWMTQVSVELAHRLNGLVAAELRRRGVKKVALLAPKSPWVQADILGHLSMQRPDEAASGQTGPILSTVRDGVVTGFKLRSVAVDVTDTPVKQELGTQLMARGFKLAARIFRPDARGKVAAILPRSIQNKAAKTPTALGAYMYQVPDGSHRDHTHGMLIAAYEKSAAKLVPDLVDLMLKIAKEERL